MTLPWQGPQPSVFLSKPAGLIEAVLFDMDGVLVDSIPLHIEAWNTAFRRNGLPALDGATYKYALGRTNMDMVVRFLGKHGIELPLTARKGIVAAKEQIFRELLKDHARALPGVMQWLEFLSERHIRCALASSGEMANVVAVLDALQLSDYFAAILSGARLPKSKPDPALFLLAAAAVGVEPGRCLVVEDAPAGVQAAKAAGMVCCAVATTCSEGELQQADILLANLGAANPELLFTDGSPGTLR